MTKQKTQDASLTVTRYVARPPEYEVIEVTRDNYDLVADWLRCREVITRRSKGIVWAVTFQNVDAINAHEKEVDAITIEFTHEPEAKSYRRYYLVRDEQFRVRVMTHTLLQSKYIQIPIEGVIE